MANFTYGDAGLALTKNFEGCVLTAYADQGGVWTIGYGHTGPGVHAGLTVTQDQADALLESDIAGSVAWRISSSDMPKCNSFVIVVGRSQTGPRVALVTVRSVEIVSGRNP